MTYADEPGLFLVDDDADILASLTALLQAHGRLVRTFPSVEAFCAALPETTVGCLLLDNRMPGTSGLAALPMLQVRYPALTVVMITAYADIDTALTAMKAGAVDFVRKPWATKTLFDAIDEASDQARRRAKAAQTRAKARGSLAHLTRRETEVFNALTSGAANKVVARKLGLSPRTVEHYRARIFEKTGCSSVAELVWLKAAERDGVQPT